MKLINWTINLIWLTLRRIRLHMHVRNEFQRTVYTRMLTLPLPAEVFSITGWYIKRQFILKVALQFVLFSYIFLKMVCFIFEICSYLALLSPQDKDDHTDFLPPGFRRYSSWHLHHKDKKSVLKEYLHLI